MVIHDHDRASEVVLGCHLLEEVLDVVGVGSWSNHSKELSWLSTKGADHSNTALGAVAFLDREAAPRLPDPVQSLPEIGRSLVHPPDCRALAHVAQ